MFTFFTDRDGKMQLESLAQSGFDPLSRTTAYRQWVFTRAWLSQAMTPRERPSISWMLRIV